MATTTNYGWTTPDDTALVKDGAAAIRTLGSSVDTTTKALNPSTTLGDIEYRSSTANTNTRLGIGTTGQILAVSGGVPAWTTPAGGGGMTLINTGGTTLTGASVTIGSIPSTYKDLQLVIRNFKPANDAGDIRARFNADTNTRYQTEQYAPSVTNKTFSGDKIFLSESNDNSVATGLIVLDIYDYANTVTWKMAHSRGIVVDYLTTTSFSFTSYGHFYNQTDAISSIVLFPSAGNFTSGTAYLYGVQ
jgi:hypothetical protein